MTNHKKESLRYLKIAETVHEDIIRRYREANGVQSKTFAPAHASILYQSVSAAAAIAQVHATLHLSRESE